MSIENSTNKFLETSLQDIFDVLYKRFKIIILLTLLGSCLSLVYAFSLNKVYVTHSISLHAEKNNMSNSGADVGILNMFAGGSSYSSGRDTLLYIQSRSFFRDLYNNGLFLKELMAYDYYDLKENVLYLDANKINNATNEWMTEQPTFEQAFSRFHNKHFSVYQHMTDEYITITTKHISREVAVKWNNMILRNINKFSKDKALIKINGAIDFYNNELNEVTTLALRNALAGGLSSQLKELALSQMDDEYALEVIDIPYYPSRATEPSFVIIIFLGSIISFFTAALAFIIKDLFSKKINL